MRTVLQERRIPTSVIVTEIRAMKSNLGKVGANRLIAANLGVSEETVRNLLRDNYKRGPHRRHLHNLINLARTLGCPCVSRLKD